MTTLPTFRPPNDDFSRYERPGAWTCGRACEGRRCSRGPSPQGRCQELDEPCVPQRSLRSRRQIFVFACTLLSVAALSVMLSKACWTGVFAPGPLTLKHAQILNKNGTSNRCAACHEAGEKSAGDWALSLVSGSPLKTPQSTLCLKCHEKGLDAVHALLPHGVAAERLAKHTAEVSGGKGQGNASEVACAACHREHHGSGHDLAAMSNQQCQTCHAKSFHSFTSGHPEFTNWPFDQAGEIKFDHSVHRAKHFPAGKQEFRCQSCHVDDSRRDVKLLASYQTACASCHESKIKQSGEEGFKLFSLPGMNVAALEEAGLGIGQWPEGISNDFDGTIPPAMAILLQADEKATKALARISGGDLSNVDPANKEQLAAAAEVALATKRLLHELATEGEAAFARRMKLESTSKLWSQLSPDLLKAAQAAWLPKLDEEMALLRAGKSLPRTRKQEPEVIQEPAAAPKKGDDEELLVPSVSAAERSKPDSDDDLLGGGTEGKAPEPAARPPAVANRVPSPGWSRNDASYSISWRPTGHGDELLKGWIEFSLHGPDTRLQGSLTKPTSIGYCTQCHAISQGSSAGSIAIHWSALHRDPAQKSFTKFSHRPHLIQPQLADCSHCHEIASTVTGFAQLSKAACTSCHTPTAAGDQCLKCHNYHISR